MEPDGGVFLEPALVLLMRVEIVEDDVKLTIRESLPADLSAEHATILAAAAAISPIALEAVKSNASTAIRYRARYQR
jgi:hypothetical protein